MPKKSVSVSVVLATCLFVHGSSASRIHSFVPQNAAPVSSRDQTVSSRDRTASSRDQTVDSVSMPGGPDLCRPWCGEWCPKQSETTNVLTQRQQFLIRCHIACTRLCRSSVAGGFIGNPSFTLLPLSADFKHYDLNGDKYITMLEFSRAERVRTREVFNAFQFADMNGDGKLTAEEFRAAPFIFTVQIAEEINAMSNQAVVSRKNVQVPTRPPSSVSQHDINTVLGRF